MRLTRFAPAPTGYLHLGHVANALYVWRTARELGASVLLRIEDHDRQRCRPEYEVALLEDLDWLGFRPDLGAADEFRRGSSAYRQSDSGQFYEAALERLQAAGHQVYTCDCSRKDEATQTPPDENAGGRYSGRCRKRGLAPGPGRGLRVVMPATVERFEDLRLGPQLQEPALQCGDLLLRDRLGNWTYQFSVVVDDLRHGIDLVIRGEDLLASTGRQLSLARMLGRPTPPRFLHHPLILKPGGEKLSKGNRDTSVRDLRAAGMSREQVLRRAAEAVGLQQATESSG
ncbi:MAG: glutamate--tRNA ligase family protein [Gemmatimonadota bacterium]